MLWHKKCHLAIYELNAGRLHTHTHTHMCGLTAHAVQLREFGSIFSRQKQHAHQKKKKKKRDKESTYKTISLGSLQCPQRRGEILEGKKIQSGRRLAQFFGQRGNSVISCMHRLPLFLPSSEPQIISPRPAERERERGSGDCLSRVGDGAPQHPEDTAGSTLAPISPDPFSDFCLKINKKKKSKINITTVEGRAASRHILRPGPTVPSVCDGMHFFFSLDSSTGCHFSVLVPSLPRQVHPAAHWSIWAAWEAAL